MNYKGVLLAVQDMERAKRFYTTVLERDVLEDFGENVTLSGGIYLQTADSWQEFLHCLPEQVLFGSRAGELYFEEDDMDAFVARLAQDKNIHYVHPLTEYRWGQRVVRFYDPDDHIIEVGESMTAVVRRFHNTPMTPAEIAARMDVPEAFVHSCLAQTE